MPPGSEYFLIPGLPLLAFLLIPMTSASERMAAWNSLTTPLLPMPLFAGFKLESLPFLSQQTRLASSDGFLTAGCLWSLFLIKMKALSMNRPFSDILMASAPIPTFQHLSASAWRTQAKKQGAQPCELFGNLLETSTEFG